VLEKVYIYQQGIHHMVINHWDVDSLLLLENPTLLPQIQEFASKQFARPPLENYTTGEDKRLVERLERHNIQFCGEYHDYEVRWNQSLPTVRKLLMQKWLEELPNTDDLKREYYMGKIMYAWEEKSAYEARGPINGVQVATNGEWINRVRFAYDGTFEDWRPTMCAVNYDDDAYLGEGGVEQDHFLLEEEEQIVQMTTYSDYDGLCGLELSTTSSQHRFWGKKSRDCKRSITNKTFLAYCSGQVITTTSGFYLPLTFHWGQTHPTACS